MTFANPLRDLPPIYRLEGYRPNRNSLYRRVLVAMCYDRAIMPAWAYEGAG